MNPLWNELAGRAGITLNDLQHTTLSRYLDLLAEANEKMNLTRITDRAAAEVNHIGDSLTLLPFLPKEPHKLADVGSGGGVPGIPLAIVRPDATITLIESTKKKAAFLRHASRTLELNNIVVMDCRAEEAGQAKERESFDVVTVRAVATMDWLAEWCLPLAKKGGKVLAMKGQKGPEELAAAARAIRTLAGGNATTHTVALPGSDHRVIIEIPKIGRTPQAFPRPASIAKGKAMS
jgi:16S rRNA (guanine527-N7)-methyltransferase